MSLCTCNLPHRYIIWNLRSPHREVKIAMLSSLPVLCPGQSIVGEGQAEIANHMALAERCFPVPGEWQSRCTQEGWLRRSDKETFWGGRTLCLRVTHFYCPSSPLPDPITFPQSEVSLKFWACLILLWSRQVNYSRRGKDSCRCRADESTFQGK